MPKQQLLPTFCSPPATLRYSIRVKVRIVDIAHDELAFEAPLQVLSCRRVGDKSFELNTPPQADIVDDQAGDTNEFEVSTPAVLPRHVH